MNTKQPQKKAPKDWHNADIVAALKKKNLSLALLSRKHGYSSNCLANALQRSYPKAESIIAQAIGESPENIWPTRYAHRNRQPVYCK